MSQILAIQYVYCHLSQTSLNVQITRTITFKINNMLGKLENLIFLYKLTVDSHK